MTCGWKYFSLIKSTLHKIRNSKMNPHNFPIAPYFQWEKNEARNQDNREIILGQVSHFCSNCVTQLSDKAFHKACWAQSRTQKSKGPLNFNWEFKRTRQHFTYIQRATKQHAAFENSAAKCMFKLECCQQFYLWELIWLSIRLSEKMSSQENSWLLNFPICGDGNMLRLFICVQPPTRRSSSVFHTYLGNSR